MSQSISSRFEKQLKTLESACSDPGFFRPRELASANLLVTLGGEGRSYCFDSDAGRRIVDCTMPYRREQEPRALLKKVTSTNVETLTRYVAQLAGLLMQPGRDLADRRTDADELCRLIGRTPDDQLNPNPAVYSVVAPHATEISSANPDIPQLQSLRPAGTSLKHKPGFSTKS